MGWLENRRQDKITRNFAARLGIPIKKKDRRGWWVVLTLVTILVVVYLWVR